MHACVRVCVRACLCVWGECVRAYVRACVCVCVIVVSMCDLATMLIPCNTSVNRKLDIVLKYN